MVAAAAKANAKAAAPHHTTTSGWQTAYLDVLAEGGEVEAGRLEHPGDLVVLGEQEVVQPEVFRAIVFEGCLYLLRGLRLTWAQASRRWCSATCESVSSSLAHHNERRALRLAQGQRAMSEPRSRWGREANAVSQPLETRGKCSVSATKPAETRGTGGVLSLPDPIGQDHGPLQAIVRRGGGRRRVDRLDLI